MTPYYDHMMTKSAHERRSHAMRVAGVVTALIFAGWVSTISLQAASGGGTNAPVAASADGSAQTAAAMNAIAQGTGSAQLIVATSTQ